MFSASSSPDVCTLSLHDALPILQPGDRILVVGENCVDMMTLYFACSLLQAWPVAVNARLSPREIDVISTHAAPRVSLYTSGISRSAAQHATHQQAQDLTLSDRKSVV